MSDRRVFPNSPEAIAQARRFVTESLHGVAAGVPEMVGLMVSELATNCVRHTLSDFTVEVEQTATRIRVAVTDRGAGEPALRSPGPSEPTGRGLRLVADLADTFGVEYSTPRVSPGKTVWFALELTPSGAADRRLSADTSIAAASASPTERGDDPKPLQGDGDASGSPRASRTLLLVGGRA